MTTSSAPKRILLPDRLELELLDFRKRIHRLETAMGRPFGLVSTPGNSATQNQTVPPAGNFDGLTKYDVAMTTSCFFTLQAPTPIIWFSYATLKLTAPGGGQYAYLTTAVSLAPWNAANWILESGSQIFDKGVSAYINSVQQLVASSTQLEGATGPGAAALGVTAGSPLLPAGTYEVRQRLIGDSGTQASFYQGNIDVFSTGG